MIGKKTSPGEVLWEPEYRTWSSRAETKVTLSPSCTLHLRLLQRTETDPKGMHPIRKTSPGHCRSRMLQALLQPCSFVLLPWQFSLHQAPWRVLRGQQWAWFHGASTEGKKRDRTAEVEQTQKASHSPETVRIMGWKRADPGPQHYSRGPSVVMSFPWDFCITLYSHNHFVPVPHFYRKHTTTSQISEWRYGRGDDH